MKIHPSIRTVHFLVLFSSLNPTPTFPSKVQHFILSTILRNFSNCSIILAFDEPFPELFEIKESLDFEGLDSYLINFQSYNFKPNGIFPSKLGSISKLRQNCVFTFIAISHINEPITFKKLFKLLIPSNFEVTKKDEDYYVFYTKYKILKNNILLSQEFSQRIKWKLLVYEQGNADGDLGFSSVCFYCNYGREKVVDLLTLEETVNKRCTFPKLSDMFPDFVRKFNGHELRVVVATGTHQQARIRPVPGVPNKFEKWRGSYFFVLDNLQEIFNFTYSVRPSTGGGTGLMFKNGTWVGTTGDVYNEVADIGLVTAVTYQRYKYVSYSYSLSWEWLTFATGLPAPNFTWEAIFWPYSSFLWICLLGSMIITIVFLALISRQNHRIGIKDRTSATSAELIFGTFLEQSFTLPDPTSLRIIVAVWLVFCLVLGTGYRSKLVTSLAFPIYTNPPASFKELADSGYRVGLCYVGGAAYSVFKSSTNPTYIKLANSMELISDLTDCFVRTLDGNAACIGYDSMANYVLAKNLTDRRGQKLIVVTTASTFFVSCGFVLTKRSIFRLHFDFYINNWDDMALITKWRSMDFENVRRQKVEWETKSNITGITAAISDGPSLLTFGNLKAVFFILLFGLLSSLVAFIGEYYCGRYHGRIRAKIKKQFSKGGDI